MEDKSLTQKQSSSKSLAQLPSDYFDKYLRLGREETTQEDLPTPYLSIIHPTSKAVDKDGRPFPSGLFYYSGTGETFKTVSCTFLSYTKLTEADYSDPTKINEVRKYLGVFNESRKPFFLSLKKGGLGRHKKFQGRIEMMHVPMFAVNVTLTASKEIGGKSGKDEFYLPVFNVEGLHADQQTILDMQRMAESFGTAIKEEEHQEPVPVAQDLPFA